MEAIGQGKKGLHSSSAVSHSHSTVKRKFLKRRDKSFNFTTFLGFSLLCLSRTPNTPEIKDLCSDLDGLYFEWNQDK